MGSTRCALLLEIHQWEGELTLIICRDTGCIATCGALLMSAAKLRAGKPKDMNYWLRARVGLQGVTVVALLLGSTWGRDWMKSKFGIKSSTPETAGLSVTEAQKKAQEKLEFEQRLRNAEEVTKQEKAVGIDAGKMTVKGPTLNKPKEEREKETTAEAVKKSEGWRLWGKGSSSSSDGKENTDSTKTS